MFKYTTIKEFLTKEHCNILLETMKSNVELHPGKIGINMDVNKTKRDSNIFFISLNNLLKIKEELQSVLSEKIKIFLLKIISKFLLSTTNKIQGVSM